MKPIESIAARRIWTSDGWLANARLWMRDGLIERIERDASASECTVPLIIPGMIELHTHGSFGYDVCMPERAGCEAWLCRLAARGVTGVLPTTDSESPQELQGALAFYSSAMDNPIPDGAKVLGVHMEGPFLNKSKKGGMKEEYIIPPSIDAFRKITGVYRGAVKQITLAPEMDGALALVRYLRAQGIRVNAGHSDATAEEMRRATEAGLDGVTHFFNAARPIHHREPGLLAEALLHDEVYCEAVCDLVHLAPEILQFLIKCVGARRLCAITDAVRETGLPDGVYGDRVVKDGSPRLFNGTLTGGRYLSDDCACALIEIGVDMINLSQPNLFEIEKMGREFGGKTVYTSILLPVVIGIFEKIFPNNVSINR